MPQPSLEAVRAGREGRIDGFPDAERQVRHARTCRATMCGVESPEIVPATIDRWEGVRDLLGAADEVGCWCQPWRGGIASMFDGAGFRRVLVTDAVSGGFPRLLVRLDLGEG